MAEHVVGHVASYGEPWRINPNTVGPGTRIDDRDSYLLTAVVPDAERAARAVACVNACAGIEDPAAALRAAREALEEAVENHCGCVEEYTIGGVTQREHTCTYCVALAALGGEAKPVNPHPEYGGDDVEDDE